MGLTPPCRYLFPLPPFTCWDCPRQPTQAPVLSLCQEVPDDMGLPAGVPLLSEIPWDSYHEHR